MKSFFHRIRYIAVTGLALTGLSTAPASYGDSLSSGFSTSYSTSFVPGAIAVTGGDDGARSWVVPIAPGNSRCDCVRLNLGQGGVVGYTPLPSWWNISREGCEAKQAELQALMDR